MIDALFVVAWVVIICVALLTGLMIVKAIRIWLDCRKWEEQAHRVHRQSAQQLMREASRRERP